MVCSYLNLLTDRFEDIMADVSVKPKKKKPVGSKKSTRQKGKIAEKEQVQIDEDVQQQKRRADCELRLRRQAESEAKAHVVTLRLITENVSAEFLKQAGQFIAVTHYKDVNEERGIARTCGYPICNEEIKSVPKQKYHISARSNQVFDISDRKNFCSAHCYKASKYFESQISTTPVWARTEEAPVQFKLMTSQTSFTIPSSGEIVFTDPRKTLLEEVEEMEKLDEVDPHKKPANKKSPVKPTPEVQEKKAEKEAEALAENIAQFLKIEGTPSKTGHVKNQSDNGSEDGSGAVEMTVGDLAKQVSDLLLVDEDNAAGSKSQQGADAHMSAPVDEHLPEQAPPHVNELADERHSKEADGENVDQAQGDSDEGKAAEDEDEAIDGSRDAAQEEEEQEEEQEAAAGAGGSDEGFQDGDDVDIDLMTAEQCQKANKYMYSNIQARTVTNITDDKINLLMSLIEKRERMKNRIQASRSEPEVAQPRDNTVERTDIAPAPSHISSLPPPRNEKPTIKTDSEHIDSTRRKPERPLTGSGTALESVDIKSASSVDINDLSEHVDSTERNPARPVSGSRTALESGDIKSASSVNINANEVGAHVETSLEDTRKLLQEVNLDGKIDIVSATGSQPWSVPANVTDKLSHASSCETHQLVASPSEPETSKASQPKDHQTGKTDIGQSESISASSKLPIVAKIESESSKDLSITDYSSLLTSSSTEKSPETKAVKVSKKDVLANIQRLSNQSSKQPVKKKKSKVKSGAPETVVSPLEAVHRTLLSWWAVNTLEHIHDVGAVGGMTRAEFEMRYAQLGRRVDQMKDIDEILEAEEDETAGKGKPALRAMPDLKQVQEDTKKFDLKVREYYKGQMTYPTMTGDELMEEGLAALKEMKKSKDAAEDEAPEPRLPLVDSHQQMSHRRKIVLEKLNLVLPSLLQPMNLRIADVSSEVRGLVYSFNLQNNNLFLRPAEWTLMAYLLLRLLSMRVPILREAFNEDSAVQYFHSLVASFGVLHSEIDSIVKKMTSNQ